MRKPAAKKSKVAQVKDGDTVRVHYTGKLEDGSIFDSSVDKDSLEFTIGQKQVFPGFEQAVMGMSLNESKTVVIPVDAAYGPHRKDRIARVPRSHFPADTAELKVGQRLKLKQHGGKTVAVTVLDLSDSTATLDANHPLAGKDLTFDLELVKIV